MYIMVFKLFELIFDMQKIKEGLVSLHVKVTLKQKKWLEKKKKKGKLNSSELVRHCIQKAIEKDKKRLHK